MYKNVFLYAKGTRLLKEALLLPPVARSIFKIYRCKRKRQIKIPKNIKL